MIPIEGDRIYVPRLIAAKCISDRPQARLVARAVVEDLGILLGYARR